MSSSYRHDEILRRLATRGRVSVEKLAKDFDVSMETVRRDLTDLEARGALRRIHGGAVPYRVEGEPPVTERARVRAREKGQIGAVGARLVEDGMSVFIDAGSTQTACSRYLIGRSSLTVTTNSLAIASTLSGSPGIRVRVTPGVVRKADNAISGQETCEYIRQFAFDLALVGIGACDPAMGWMDFEEQESNLRRLVLPQARRVVILADSSKFGKRAAIQTFPLSQPLTLVTDRRPSAPFDTSFRKAGTQVIVPR